MNKEFETVKVNEEGLNHLRSIRIDFDALLRLVDQYSSPCRELDLCSLKLEEACFYAIKSISKHYRELE